IEVLVSEDDRLEHARIEAEGPPARVRQRARPRIHADPDPVEADPEAPGRAGLEGGRHAAAAGANEHDLVVVETGRRRHGGRAGQGAWISDAARRSEISPRAAGGSGESGPSTVAAGPSGRIPRFT